MSTSSYHRSQTPVPAASSHGRNPSLRTSATRKPSRRSSLTGSLQNLARSTFHRRSRHTTTEVSSSCVTPVASSSSRSSSSCNRPGGGTSPLLSLVQLDGAVAQPVTPPPPRLIAEVSGKPGCRLLAPIYLPEETSGDCCPGKALEALVKSTEQLPHANTTVTNGALGHDTVLELLPPLFEQGYVGEGEDKRGMLEDGTSNESVPSLSVAQTGGSPRSSRFNRSGSPRRRNTCTNIPIPTSPSLSPPFRFARDGSRMPTTSSHQSMDKTDIKNLCGQSRASVLEPILQQPKACNNIQGTQTLSRQSIHPYRQQLQRLETPMPKSLTMGAQMSHLNVPATTCSPTGIPRTVYHKASLKPTASMTKSTTILALPTVAVPSRLSAISNLDGVGERPKSANPSRVPVSVRFEDVKMVTTAQPQQYWLGRFMTLVNSFHYEDSFSAPDPVTGYGRQTPISYLAGPSAAAATSDDRRTKRAFMFLERVCTTDEARASFIEFRNAYSKRHGDIWTKWFISDAAVDKLPGAGNVDKGSPMKLSTLESMKEMYKDRRKSSESGGQPSGGIINMFKSVRRSLA
ncbi:hypothetical protein AJ80_07119 [Polytolypa hystricis UAMH7299]|uniref:Uncharacterized protein n=1 Tax=Polytolypa hystricis (strain UAMH7299) TaxID=1447883 RepID=A0A2B7XR41_POLH7|nr:hypothetical protein AJ80_07119 [Polytolypa hystricis UAMH7299]